MEQKFIEGVYVRMDRALFSELLNSIPPRHCADAKPTSSPGDDATAPVKPNEQLKTGDAGNASSNGLILGGGASR